MGNEVDRVLAKKIIWPFPSKDDDDAAGEDSSWLERKAIATEAGYKKWKTAAKDDEWSVFNSENIS